MVRDGQGQGNKNMKLYGVATEDHDEDWFVVVHLQKKRLNITKVRREIELTKSKTANKTNTAAWLISSVGLL